MPVTVLSGRWREHPNVRVAVAARVVAGVVLLALSACAFSVDGEQLRVCRSILPALNPGAHVSVTHAEPGPVPASVRVNYTVERVDRPPRDRWAICRFAAEGLSGSKADLTDVNTDQGALSGANVYLLKRYYLETPEGVAGDPGSRVEALVPEVPAPFAYSLQQLLVSLPRTAIYG